MENFECREATSMNFVISDEIPVRMTVVLCASVPRIYF